MTTPTPTDPIEERASPPAETPPGQPITAYDERLVRQNGGFGSWPIPGLLAEIDRLRRIEGAARAVVDGNRTSYSQEAALIALREALR